MSNTETAVSVEEKMARIRLFIVEEFELDIPVEEVSDEANFVDEYEADSLALIQVVSRMDRELGVKMPQSEIEELHDLNAIRAYLERPA